MRVTAAAAATLAVSVAWAANDSTITTVAPTTALVTPLPPAPTTTLATTSLSPPTTESPSPVPTTSFKRTTTPAPPITSPTSEPTTEEPTISPTSEPTTEEPTSDSPRTTKVTTKRPTATGISAPPTYSGESGAMENITPSPSVSTTSSKATSVTTIAPPAVTSPADSTPPSSMNSATTLGLLGGGLVLFVAAVVFIYLSIRKKLHALSAQADAEYEDAQSPPPTRHSSMSVSSARGIARAASSLQDIPGSWRDSRGGSFSHAGLVDLTSSDRPPLDLRPPSMSSVRSVHAYLGSGSVRYSSEYGGLVDPRAEFHRPVSGTRSRDGSFQSFDPHAAALAVHGRAMSFSGRPPVSSGRRLSGDLGAPPRRSNDLQESVHHHAPSSAIPRTASAPMALSSMIDSHVHALNPRVSFVAPGGRVEPRRDYFSSPDDDHDDGVRDSCDF